MKYIKVKHALAYCYGAVLATMPFVAHAQSAATLTPPRGTLISRQAIAVDLATHKAYAVNTGRNTISVIDGKSLSVSIIPVGKDPVSIAIDQATNRVYVVNHGSGTISVLNGATNALIATIPVGSLPFAVAVNPATDRVYISNVFSDVLTVIDGATDTKKTMNAGSADAMAIDSRLNDVYLLGYESANLTLLDASKGTLHPIPMGKMHLWGMALDAPEKTLYITRIGSASMVALHEVSHATTIIPTGKFPCAVVVNPATQMVYVANYGSNSVTVIDGRSHSVVATIAVGLRPQAVAVNAATDRIYVANTLGKSVTVIDGHSNTVVATRKVKGTPYALAIDAGRGRLYAALFGQPSFTILTLQQTQKPTR